MRYAMTNILAAIFIGLAVFGLAFAFNRLWGPAAIMGMLACAVWRTSLEIATKKHRY